MCENLTFKQYLHLKHLAEVVIDLADFIAEIGHDPERYKVDGWSTPEYGRFYERVRGGHLYDHLTTN